MKPTPIPKNLEEYLGKEYRNNQEDTARAISALEEKIPIVLKEQFGKDCASICELNVTDDVKSVIGWIKSDPLLNALDRHQDFPCRYTSILRKYDLFLKTLSEEEKVILTSSPEIVEETYVEGENFEEGEDDIINNQYKRQRNMALKEACKAHYRKLHNGHLICECCGFEFSKVYEIEGDYIEIHHLTPLAQTEGVHTVNAQHDLVPLCANCHRMIHYNQGGHGNCMSFEELKKKYKGQNYQ